MKLKEKKPEIVFRIINKQGEAVGSYSHEYDFESVHEARSANEKFKDKKKYKVARYHVIYKLLDPDCD